MLTYTGSISLCIGARQQARTRWDSLRQPGHGKRSGNQTDPVLALKSGPIKRRTLTGTFVRRSWTFKLDEQGQHTQRLNK